MSELQDARRKMLLLVILAALAIIAGVWTAFECHGSSRPECQSTGLYGPPPD